MTLKLSNPPRFYGTNPDQRRKATWLELFYDLVFVATVVQLSSKLSEEVSGQGVLEYVLLFIPIWWVWLGTTLYFNRFDADDAIHRVLIFAQIFIVSATAISIYDGFGDTSALFSLSYAAARGVLVLMYLRAGYFVPEARALCQRYAIGFGIAALVWIASAIAPPPFRFILGTIGLLIDFGTPLTYRSRRLQAMLPPNTHHLPERLGLLTIILIGESFLKVIGAYPTIVIDRLHVIWGALGLLLVGSMWWIYFENIADRHLTWGTSRAQAWLYLHLPFHISLPALAVGIYKLVTMDPDHGGFKPEYRLLMAGAVALALFTMARIEAMVKPGRGHAVEITLRIGSALVALAIGVFGAGLDPTLFIGLLVGIGVLQIAYDVMQEAIGEREAHLPPHNASAID